MTIENTVKEYRKAVKAANKELEELQQTAAELTDAIGEREQLQARLAFLEERSTGLMSKRESLKRRYSEADFEGDTEQQESIRNLRTRLDEELEQVETEELQLQEQLKQHPVDPAAMADVYVKAQLVSLPEHKKLLAEIELELKNEEKAIRASVEDIHASLPRKYFNSSHTEAARLRHDKKYAARERAFERAWKKREEALAEEDRYRGIVRDGNFSGTTTDDTLNAMGYVRSLRPGKQVEQGKAKPWDKLHAQEEEGEIVLSR